MKKAIQRGRRAMNRYFGDGYSCAIRCLKHFGCYRADRPVIWTFFLNSAKIKL